ncbi:MAG: hypothetical protein ACRD4Q_12910 [Candidatus Acidiferrales bacterium]
MIRVKIRLLCSLLALAVIWTVSGIAFTSLAGGRHLLTAWLVWGTAIFLVGWVVVGLPVVALGDRVASRKYLPVVSLSSGLGGAFFLFLPDLVARFTGRVYSYEWSLADLVWPAIGFSMAAATALMYWILLRRFPAGSGH